MNADDLLEHLRSRRSVRRFRPDPVPRDVIERVLSAAITAPSATNRQPWRFHVLTGAARERVAGLVKARVREMEAIVARGHHRDAIGTYGDFFHEPLEAASVVIVPAFRTFDDLIARLVASGGEDPTRFDTSAAMESERCGTAAACMALLLQAEAEGLGACWMAGPMVARAEIEATLGVTPPWRMLGAVSLGWPDEVPTAKPRRDLAQVVRWLDE